MRASSAVLSDVEVRLWDLIFPSRRPLVARTRAAYIHIDNLITYSKRDRDGQVDAYLACYRPDEIVLLFFLRGELANAALFAPVGRFQVAIGEALRHIKAEPERAEIAFHEAPAEQLAAMFATCSQPPDSIGLDPANPERLFRPLLERKWTGLLELISNGRVNYVQVREGRFYSGLFADPRPDEPPNAYVARMFTGAHPEPLPRVSARAYAGLAALPRQAPPAMVQVFRQFVWDIVDLAERELPDDAAKRAERVRARLSVSHEVLRSVGGARGALLTDPIAEPSRLAEGVAAWTREYLNELEIVHPGIAPQLLKEAGREQRFALAAVGFFERLPWKVEW